MKGETEGGSLIDWLMGAIKVATAGALKNVAGQPISECVSKRHNLAIPEAYF
jgi:hypothetical protein